MEPIKQYLRKPYARIVVPAGPRSFHAEILEFPGCFAQGDTVEKAYESLEKAAESWIESSLSQGHSIPEPSTSIDYSGRIALRLPTSVHEQAARLAERNDTSLNTFIVSAVSEKVGVEELYNVVTQRLEQHFLNFANAWAKALYQNAASTGIRRLRSTRLLGTASTSSTLPPVANVKG